jgi:hypothetical protein
LTQLQCCCTPSPHTLHNKQSARVLAQARHSGVLLFRTP